MAGMHKHKWSYTVKYAPDHFGHDAMPRPNRIETTRWLNLIDIGAISAKAGSSKELDLGKMGYQKLLGSGSVDKAYTIRIPRASKNALEKIKAAGGNVDLTSAPWGVPEKEEKPEALPKSKS
jgi:large subunit ribosomal protein L15